MLFEIKTFSFDLDYKKKNQYRNFNSMILISIMFTNFDFDYQILSTTMQNRSSQVKSVPPYKTTPYLYPITIWINHTEKKRGYSTTTINNDYVNIQIQ